MENSQIQQPSVMQHIHKEPHRRSFYIIISLVLLMFGLFIGSSGTNIWDSQADFSVAGIRVQDGSLSHSDGPSFQNVQLTNTSVVQLYQTVQDSVVTVTAQRLATDNGGEFDLAQGSGFVYNFNDRMVIITNFHVINQAVEVSVTFADGNGYAADILGSDPYADLAVLTAIDAPASQYEPLQAVSSSTLRVGDFVVAVGSPFGLSGSMTTGIVSQLGRTITSPTTSNYPVANVIQTDAPINPGNSGGPLLNNQGQVIGINTATVSESTGIGFAVPSNTLLREISDLINTGSYNRHPYLGISSIDMNYYIAQEMDVDVTYGVLLQQVTPDGPADDAGLRAGNTQTTINGATLAIGGDIIIAINENNIINTDDLSSYLEENTQPNQQITVTIVRNGQTQEIPVTLGTRPPPDTSANPTPFRSPLPTSATPTLSPTTPPSSTISEITLVTIIVVLAIAVTIIAIVMINRRKEPTPVLP